MGDKRDYESKHTISWGQKWVTNIITRTNVVLVGGKNG
jgi:hypothetical protein